MEDAGAELLVQPEALVENLATVHCDAMELAFLYEPVLPANFVALLACVQWVQQIT